MSFFAGDMILYIGYPKDSNKKTIRNKDSKVEGYKNQWKFTAFLYKNNEISEKYEKNSFCNCNQMNKIPRNKLSIGYEGHIYWKLQHIIKRYCKTHSEMEKHSVFIAWNNQHS